MAASLELGTSVLELLEASSTTSVAAAVLDTKSETVTVEASPQVAVTVPSLFSSCVELTRGPSAAHELVAASTELAKSTGDFCKLRMLWITSFEVELPVIGFCVQDTRVDAEEKLWMCCPVAAETVGDSCTGSELPATFAWATLHRAFCSDARPLFNLLVAVNDAVAAIFPDTVLETSPVTSVLSVKLPDANHFLLRPRRGLAMRLSVAELVSSSFGTSPFCGDDRRRACCISGGYPGNIDGTAFGRRRRFLRSWRKSSSRKCRLHTLLRSLGHHGLLPVPLALRAIRRSHSKRTFVTGNSWNE